MNKFLPELKGLNPMEVEPRHKAVLLLLFLHAPLVLIYGLAAGDAPVWQVVASAVVLVVLAKAAGTAKLGPAKQAKVAALGLAVAPGLLIAASGGAWVAHLDLFAVLPIVTLYGSYAAIRLVLVALVVELVGVALWKTGAVYADAPSDGEVLARAAGHFGFALLTLFPLLIAWKVAEVKTAFALGIMQQMGERQGELERQVAELTEAAEAGAAAEAPSAVVAEVRTAAHDVATSAEEIRETVTRNTAAATQQSAAMQQAASAVEQVREVAERTAAEAGEVATEARSSFQLTEEGASALRDILDNLNRIREEVGATSSGVSTLSERVRQIGEITAAVDDLSEQSKLLALNASIEAARAGEHGRGFAVVAEEVRALAERSRESTAAVDEILREIDVATREAVVAAQRGAEVVEAGAKRAAETEDVIARLSQVSLSSADRVAEIAEAAGDQRRRIEEVAAAIREAADQTGELVGVATHAEEVASRLQGLAGELESITARA